MARRIVKFTYKDGSVRYRVESNRIFLFIPWEWHMDCYPLGEGANVFVSEFLTLEEAIEYNGESTPVVEIHE